MNAVEQDRKERTDKGDEGRWRPRVRPQHDRHRHQAIAGIGRNISITGMEKVAHALILADREPQWHADEVAIMKPSRMRRTLMAILTRYLFDSPTWVNCVYTS